MKTSQKMTSVIILILMVTSFTMMTNVASVNAQPSAVQPSAGQIPNGVTPNATVKVTGAYLSVTPSPVGLNQQLLINMWIIPAIHRQRQFIKAFEIDITKPDGTTETMGDINSYCGDGTAWLNYVPDQVGTWRFKFNFLGMYFPTGYYYNGKAYPSISAMPAEDLAKLGQVTYGSMSSPTYLASAYYEPASSPVIEVVVQQDMVASWPPKPLPTDYWVRPAYSENREWWPILGNYPATGIVGGGPNWPADTNIYMNNYGFIPYVQAPNSAHVVWKRQGAMGGLIGGASGQITYELFAGTGEIGFPSVIYMGRCYETITKVSQTGATPQNYWQCFDLRTGELYWERPLYAGEATGPTFIEYAEEAEEVPGATARIGITAYLVTITGSSGTTPGRILKYNPWNGALVVNITGPIPGVPAGTLYAGPYVLSIQNLGAGKGYRLINWTIENNAGPGYAYNAYGQQPIVDNFTARIISNISFPFSSLGTCDFETMVSVNSGSINPTGTGVTSGQFYMGASLTTGQLLWNITLNADTGYNQFFGVQPRADHGKFATRNRDGSYYCFDIMTGKFLWKSPMSSYPWGVWEAYNVESAYGHIFMTDYAGCSAINWDTGKIDWTFISPTPFAFETPYEVNGTGIYSFHSAGQVADGKVFVVNTEHSPSQPLTRGWRLFCLNATTGEEIWSISNGQGAPGSRAFQGAIADGYLAMTNEYDGYMYVYGKGKSATTVTAPQTAVPLGTSILIEGTVLDQSPAQLGTPCVSKDSMSTQMEYLHNQYPIDGLFHNVTMVGVPVSLTAKDSSGKVIDIGTATTNAYYGTFSKSWTPPKEDTYTITASFTSDASYGSSSAATSLIVGPTTASSATQPEVVVPDYTMLILGGIIA
ncbi:MAG: PQQ-binding-like beta-propeller repeat protein, partial [Chloroflexota bacterium]